MTPILCLSWLKTREFDGVGKEVLVGIDVGCKMIKMR
jgi:hypothetical protein